MKDKFFTSDFQSYGYGFNGLRGFVNLIPFSKKKNKYCEHVEFKLGLSILGNNNLLDKLQCPTAKESARSL